MKLLTPKDLGAVKAAEIAREVMRTEEARKAYKKSQIQLNDIRAQFDLTLANQRVKWVEEEEKHREEIKKLKDEVILLEKKRDEALIPIEIADKRAYTVFKDAEELLNKATAKEEENSALTALLESKLDEISSKEEDIIAREQKTSVREANLEAEKAHIKKLSADLNEESGRLWTAHKEKENYLEKENRRLQLLLISIEARNVMLKEKEKQLSNWSIQINDREQTLERELERIKNNVNTIHKG